MEGLGMSKMAISVTDYAGRQVEYGVSFYTKKAKSSEALSLADSS